MNGHLTNPGGVQAKMIALPGEYKTDFLRGIQSLKIAAKTFRNTSKIDSILSYEIRFVAKTFFMENARSFAIQQLGYFS